MTTDDDTARLDAADAGGLRLLLVQGTRVDVLALGESDDLVIGRSDPADVVVDADGLSRRHLRVRRRRGLIEVCDLGSTNGTVHVGANGQAPVPAGVFVEVSAGDELRLGALRIHVTGATPRDRSRPRGLLAHERFVVVVDEEIERARLFQRTAALALVRVAGGDLAAASSALGRVLRPVDRCGVWAKDIIEVLWPEGDVVTTTAWLAALLPKLPGGSAAGFALWPVSATSAGALAAAATHALQKARAGGVECAPAIPRMSDRAGGDDNDDDGPVAVDPVTRELFQTTARLSRSRIAVLLQGETGSGKEVVARAIHESADKPFVAVNCGALPPSLVESTLFGHEKGAFTGADATRKGAFEQAHGGTLFLDEVAELPAAAQAALLRVLETRRVRRVGAATEQAVDVRIVAASHRDLAALVAAGGFREDLLFRLNAFVLEVPPLRDRRGDLPALSARFLAGLRTEGRTLSLAPDVDAALAAWRWPGNVRELKNVLERAAVLTDGALIDLEHLPLDLQRAAATTTTTTTTRSAAAASADRIDDVDDRALPLPERLDKIETHLITRALDDAGGDTAVAALALGLPRRTLQHRLKVLGIKR
ncbi:MAG: sigma 54-dependent Fis family transcriptional regulator [Deltaproteobacteria bacterium]|nr:sigma 54-dependent Fis family transcriptional regulator [Deltaproteobacteria bacterium]